MWVDILDRSFTKRPLPQVLEEVAERHAAALEAEVWGWVTQSYDFRHAVVLVDEKGNCLGPSETATELAGQLLVEWGRARGGEPDSEIETESWDFNARRGYAMTFRGTYHEPETPTRLSGQPTTGHSVLRDREEAYVVVTKPADAETPADA